MDQNVHTMFADYWILASFLSLRVQYGAIIIVSFTHPTVYVWSELPNKRVEATLHATGTKVIQTYTLQGSNISHLGVFNSALEGDILVAWRVTLYPIIITLDHTLSKKSLDRLVPQGVPAEMMLLFIGAVNCFAGILQKEVDCIGWG